MHHYLPDGQVRLHRLRRMISCRDCMVSSSTEQARQAMGRLVRGGHREISVIGLLGICLSVCT